MIVFLVAVFTSLEKIKAVLFKKQNSDKKDEVSDTTGSEQSY